MKREITDGPTREEVLLRLIQEVKEEVNAIVANSPVLLTLEQKTWLKYLLLGNALKGVLEEGEELC